MRKLTEEDLKALGWEEHFFGAEHNYRKKIPGTSAFFTEREVDAMLSAPLEDLPKILASFQGPENFELWSKVFIDEVLRPFLAYRLQEGF